MVTNFPSLQPHWGLHPMLQLGDELPLCHRLLSSCEPNGSCFQVMVEVTVGCFPFDKSCSQKWLKDVEGTFTGSAYQRHGFLEKIPSHPAESQRFSSRRKSRTAPLAQTLVQFRVMTPIVATSQQLERAVASPQQIHHHGWVFSEIIA